MLHLYFVLKGMLYHLRAGDDGDYFLCPGKSGIVGRNVRVGQIGVI